MIVSLKFIGTLLLPIFISLDVFGDKKVACLMAGSSNSFFLTTELCFREYLNLFGSPNRLFYSSSQRHNIHAFPKAIQIISPILHHLSAFRQMHRSIIGTAVGVTYRELRPETKQHTTFSSGCKEAVSSPRFSYFFSRCNLFGC